MKHYILLLIRIAIAVILLQTLRYKFFAHPDSIYIFSTIGIEPWGRIGTGIMELIAGILILIPSTVLYGACLTSALMAGAVMMHITILGIEVQGDNGLLFYTALITLFFAIILVYQYRHQSKMLRSF